LQVDTLEKLLERGEKLDDLVERSNQLSSQAKLFYKVVGNEIFSKKYDY